MLCVFAASTGFGAQCNDGVYLNALGDVNYFKGDSINWDSTGLAVGGSLGYSFSNPLRIDTVEDQQKVRSLKLSFC